ncbi:uncharacterized protein LAESUDRAFT_641501, partial [Laetiporus sulphureus 93-53]
RARLHVNHIIFARARTHISNSLVMFYPHGNRSSPTIAGSIEHIYIIDGHPRFTVRRYLPAVLNGPDPFTRWFNFPARTWSTERSQTLEKVKVQWVLSQFAEYAIFKDHVIVLELNQVGIARLPTWTTHSHLSKM